MTRQPCSPLALPLIALSIGCAPSRPPTSAEATAALTTTTADAEPAATHTTSTDAEALVRSLSPWERPLPELVSALEALPDAPAATRAWKDAGRLFLVRWSVVAQQVDALQDAYRVDPSWGGSVRPLLDEAASSTLDDLPISSWGEAMGLSAEALPSLNILEPVVSVEEVSFVLLLTGPDQLDAYEPVWDEIAAQQRAVGVPMRTLLLASDPDVVRWGLSWAAERPASDDVVGRIEVVPDDPSQVPEPDGTGSAGSLTLTFTPGGGASSPPPGP